MLRNAAASLPPPPPSFPTTEKDLDISGRRLSRIIHDRNECADAFRIDLAPCSYIFHTVEEDRVVVSSIAPRLETL